MRLAGEFGSHFRNMLGIVNAFHVSWPIEISTEQPEQLGHVAHGRDEAFRNPRNHDGGLQEAPLALEF